MQPTSEMVAKFCSFISRSARCRFEIVMSKNKLFICIATAVLEANQSRLTTAGLTLPSASTSSTPPAPSTASLLALHDSDLLCAVAFHVATETALITASGSVWRLEALPTLWIGRDAVLPSSAKTSSAGCSWWTVALVHHELHEGVLVRGVEAGCHHLLHH